MLNFVIATDTDPNYRTDGRYTYSFDAILTPIYLDFIEAILDSRKLNTPKNHIPHRRINDVYYGAKGTYGVTGNIFDHPLDAIEIQNLEAKIYKQTC